VYAVQSVEKSTVVSEEHITSIFRAEELAEKETSVKAGVFLLDPDEGGNMFLRNDV
jgi:hypothetical protein